MQALLGGASSTILQSLPAEATLTVAYTISHIFGMVLVAGALMLPVLLLMKHEKIDGLDVAAGDGWAR